MPKSGENFITSIKIKIYSNYLPIVLNISIFFCKICYRVRRLIFTIGLELANNFYFDKKSVPVITFFFFIVDECAVLCIVMNVRLLITLLLRIFLFANYFFVEFGGRVWYCKKSFLDETVPLHDFKAYWLKMTRIFGCNSLPLMNDRFHHESSKMDE